MKLNYIQLSITMPIFEEDLSQEEVDILREEYDNIVLKWAIAWFNSITAMYADESNVNIECEDDDGEERSYLATMLLDGKD